MAGRLPMPVACPCSPSPCPCPCACQAEPCQAADLQPQELPTCQVQLQEEAVAEDGAGAAGGGQLHLPQCAGCTGRATAPRHPGVQLLLPPPPAAPQPQVGYFLPLVCPCQGLPQTRTSAVFSSPPCSGRSGRSSVSSAQHLFSSVVGRAAACCPEAPPPPPPCASPDPVYFADTVDENIYEQVGCD
ncbi:Histone-lysine N-methyltransferase ATXR3 [Frankliniella fusca]|uniref:Histone-lysine N-methyltransferase ATXR3 n=1 Tax=Frankliniella fusca TaxID=407009 RepID=A0AAE1LIY3_9NEOP|nr:Histone-lysine N-methyltransferase ATXR3 [Frankliniella fusca]